MIVFSYIELRISSFLLMLFMVVSITLVCFSDYVVRLSFIQCNISFVHIIEHRHYIYIYIALYFSSFWFFLFLFFFFYFLRSIHALLFK